VEQIKVSETTPALAVRAVSKSFGGFIALDKVSLDLREGERRALIGPNGAGKTTLFNLLSGRLRADCGEITYFGKSIRGLPGHEICRLGIGRTFQITSIYPRLTCLQNVQTALFARNRRSHWLLRYSHSVDAEEAMELLGTVGIAGVATSSAALLSYGDQKRLELAMVLGIRPRLLLLDEPTAGVDVSTRRELVALVKRLCAQHALTLLFCEHDMDAVFSIADRITVLHQGRVLTEGTAAEIIGDAVVRSVYLGATRGSAS
jgi:branched-chain amino acid transport system ATP-binding protein